MDFVEAFRAKMPMFRGFLVDSNFKACANAATDLLRASEFAKYPEGVFIGEYFEALFIELRGLVGAFEVKKEDVEKMQKAVNSIIDFIEANIPITDTDKKAELYSLLLNARYIVTENQLTYFREKKPKPRPMRFPSPSIPLEEDEG